MISVYHPFRSIWFVTLLVPFILVCLLVSLTNGCSRRQNIPSLTSSDLLGFWVLTKASETRLNRGTFATTIQSSPISFELRTGGSFQAKNLPVFLGVSDNGRNLACLVTGTGVWDLFKHEDETHSVALYFQSTVSCEKPPGIVLTVSMVKQQTQMRYWLSDPDLGELVEFEPNPASDNS